MGYYTNVIFKNRRINFDESDNENHKVLASEQIKAGEILLIEHLVNHKSVSNMLSYVKNNKDLFESLYPRSRSYSYEDRAIGSDKEDEIMELAIEKVQKNVFCINGRNGEKYYALGVNVSKFNHKRMPNTYMNIAKMHGNNKCLCFVAIKSRMNIEKGEEITINYGRGYFSESEGEEAPKSMNMSDTINILEKYMDKPIFDKIYKNMALANSECIYQYDKGEIVIGKKLKN